MKFFKEFVSKMFIVISVGALGMLLAGWMLTVIQSDTFSASENFFSYKMQHLDQTPAWFVFILLQMAVNGFWMFKLAVIEGGFRTPDRGGWGYWGVELPINDLKVFAVNMIIIPVSMFLFMFIRYNNW